MHDFRYSAPHALGEALSLLAEDGARPFAGGTDLLVQMRAGSRRPAHLVDVKGIEELNALSCDEQQGLRLGAAVPCHRAASHPGLRRLFPGLAEAIALIGSTQIQSRATVGGNLANGSPAADTAPALIAIGARCRIAGPGGSREIAVEDLPRGPGETALAPGELLVEIAADPPLAGSADAYLRMTPRNEMDIAIVGAGARVTLEGTRCTAARVALGAAAPTPLLVEEAAAALVGRPIDDAALEEAGRAAAARARPISDMRGTAEYRREVAAVLVRRAVAEAARRAAERR